MNKLRFLIMTVLLILVFAGCEQSANTRSPDSPGQTEIMKKRKFSVVIENTTEADCRVNVGVYDPSGDGNTSGWTTVSGGTIK